MAEVGLRMEDALGDLENVADFLENFIENGPSETVATPEDIAYASGLCILAFFGTLGNILILIMFSKKEFSRTSYSIYIRAAAVSDTIFMLMNISEDVMDHATSYKTDQFIGSSYQFCIFWSVTKVTFRCASPWIVVALALDRCIAIWNPLHRTCFGTKKAAAIVTFSIVLASLGVELGLALPFTTTVMGEDFYTICVTTWMRSGEVLTIKRLVTETGLPCIIMLIPNLLVIFKIQQSYRFRRSFSTRNEQQGKIAKSSRPLLVVSCLAFITLLPISITEVVELTKMNNAAVEDYGNYYDNNDYFDNNDFYDNDDFHQNDPDELNRINSFGRMFDESVLNLPGDILDNITLRNSSDETDKGVNTNRIESTNAGTDEERDINPDLIENTNLGTDEERYINPDLIESTNLGTDEERDINPDLIESTNLGTDEEKDINPDLIESTNLGTDEERDINPDLIENTNLGTDEERDINPDLIESTNLGTDEERDINPDLIESTNLGTDEEKEINTDLIESTGSDFEDADDGRHDEMVEDDMENREDEHDEEEEEFENSDDLNLLDSIWKTCNFIYMCNFSQNFYLLIMSSKRYRATLLKMFYCGRNKHYTEETQKQTETISSSLDT